MSLEEVERIRLVSFDKLMVFSSIEIGTNKESSGLRMRLWIETRLPNIINYNLKLQFCNCKGKGLGTRRNLKLTSEKYKTWSRVAD